MELYARRNLYTEALRQYRQCREALRRELDVAPEPATEALYRELMRKRRAAGIADTGEVPILDGEAATAPTESSDTRLKRPGLRDAVVLVASLDGLPQFEAELDPEESRALALAFLARVRTEPIDSTRAQGASGWELRAIHLSDASATPRFFVGRRPELAMLTAGLDRCIASRHGRAIIVRGDAGIGKTRLTEALRALARERGVGVHCVQVFDFGQKAIRRPLAALSFSLLGLAPEASTEERAARVASVAADANETIFLSEMIDAPLSDELRALQQAMSSARRMRGIDEALGKLLRMACETSPQLITLEDLHWASAEEVERVAAWLTNIANTPTLLVATSRPEGEQAQALIKAGGRRCPVTTLDLAPMADDEARELAALYPHLSPATVDACIQRAEGYPLFLEQLLRAASANPQALPSSIRSLVVARADRLQPNDLTALHAAAVLGQRCESDALRAVTGIDTYEPDALIDSGLMRQEGRELEFAHALFRDAVYQSIVRSERRELHALAAEWFQGREPILHADHLAGAEDKRAAAAYIEAARVERRALRIERALDCARKAQSLAPSPAVLHEATCLVGDMYLQSGRTHLALAAFRESLECAHSPLAQVESWLGVASALRIMDRYHEAIEALDTAESKLNASASAQLQVRLWTLRGNLYFPLGRLEECLQAHARAHEYAVAADSPLDMARADGGLCDAWYQRGRMLTARKHVVRCLEAARKHQLQALLLSYLPMLAVTQAYCAEIDAAMASNEEALALAQRIGDQRGELLAHLTTASVSYMAGELEHCLVHTRQTQALADQLGARRFKAESLGTQANTLIALGDRAQALELIRTAIALSRETGMSYCGPVLLGILARATTDDEERQAALEEAETLLAAGCVSYSYLDFYTAAIELSLERGRWNEARRYAAALANYTAAEPLPWSDAVVERANVLADAGEFGAPRVGVEALRSLRERFARMPTKPMLHALDECILRCERTTAA